MSDNYYSEINLHLTWHTKLSRPLLTPEVEAMTFACLREKAAALGDVYIHEIGGTETHVHVAVSIEPTVLISELVGTLKGYSAHEVNRRVGRKQKVLQWQTGYGVVSFGTGDLPWVTAYIRNQKEHHGRGKTHERLERIHRFDDTSYEAEAEEEAFARRQRRAEKAKGRERPCRQFRPLTSWERPIQDGQTKSTRKR